MKKQRVFLTGASGAMGFLGLKELLKYTDKQDIVILVRPSEKNKKLMAPYEGARGLTIKWGDLTRYKDVYESVMDADIILHVASFVSPAADYYPKEAMKINFGSIKNIVRAIEEQGRKDDIKVVSIGTVAETGDRLPPIHWGRVGDPIKPSIYDNYAVSKVAAERYLIESGIKYWVSLRQTGIMGLKMNETIDPIMFHNCFNNAHEFVSDRDSAILLGNLCSQNISGELPDTFWGHVYNIGGGESCRINAYDMYKTLFGLIGVKDLSSVLDSKWFATRNFHGQFYLDSDKLENILHFRHDSIEYNYEAYLKTLGLTGKLSKFVTKLPGGQALIGNAMKNRFTKLAQAEHGTMNFIGNGLQGEIAAYWGSGKACQAIPPIDRLARFTEWDKVVHIDHGYDESKPESELSLCDVKGAAEFRGGKCLSDVMAKGDWKTKLRFSCAFGHEFNASPRLILEGGHWCPVCENESWNYQNRAKVDPFFAQVWYPLHDKDEEPVVYKKVITENDI